MSLPACGGYASGVRGYDGADLSEYEAVITNSQSAEPELMRMGARRALTLHFGADPDLFSPRSYRPDVDCFCASRPSNASRLRHMVTAPRWTCPPFVAGSARRPRPRQSSSGRFSPADSVAGPASPPQPQHRAPCACGQPGFAMRLSELAAMGCCIVSGRSRGGGSSRIEKWSTRRCRRPSDANLPRRRTRRRDWARLRVDGCCRSTRAGHRATLVSFSRGTET
jgi:hypothetical protein